MTIGEMGRAESILGGEEILCGIAHTKKKNPRNVSRTLASAVCMGGVDSLESSWRLAAGGWQLAARQ